MYKEREKICGKVIAEPEELQNGDKDCHTLVKHHLSPAKRLNLCLKRTTWQGFAPTIKTEPYTLLLSVTNT